MTSTDRPLSDTQALAVAIAPPATPVLTFALPLVLAAVFACEIAYGIGAPTGPMQPTIATLIAFGGLSHDLVLKSGEWYRLLSAPFLHANAAHLGMNAFALFIAGRTMERLIGRAWFGAVYTVGAIVGSVLSLELNPPSVVGVGASGAIMSLFAAELIVGMHFPPGPIRTALRSNAIYVLVLSILPNVTTLQSHGRADYAAHAGGAIGGAAMGFAMLAVWRGCEPTPRLKPIAALIGLAGLIALAYPVKSVLEGYEAATFITQLIPDEQYPKNGTEMRARLPQLIAHYPRDPRPRYSRAAQLLDARDFAGAEREARLGLADETLWRGALSPQLSYGLRTLLAIAISKDRPEQAIETARVGLHRTEGRIVPKDAR
jgi:rhomboid protease GluP